MLRLLSLHLGMAAKSRSHLPRSFVLCNAPFQQLLGSLNLLNYFSAIPARSATIIMPLLSLTQDIASDRDATEPEWITADREQPQPVIAPLDAVIDGLQQRELLDPLLLLSAGYLALPFLLHQGVLLLTPLLALCGFSLNQEEATRVVSN
jgi:hypothetical protein